MQILSSKNRNINYERERKMGGRSSDEPSPRSQIKIVAKKKGDKLFSKKKIRTNRRISTATHKNYFCIIRMIQTTEL